MEIERQRILHGQSVCILGFAEEWAEQECKKLREAGDGLAHWLYPGKLESMLGELRHAVRSRLLKVYDFGRERDYRETDTAKIEKGHIHVMPRSANAWLVCEGFAPLELCADDVCEAVIHALDESTSLPSVVSLTGTAPEPLQNAGQPDTQDGTSTSPAPGSVGAGAEGVTKTGATRLQLRQTDPARRLAALRELRGDVRWIRGEWAITGIVELEEQEKAENRPRSSQKTIRADLITAAEAERNEQREGNGVTAPAWCPQ